MLSTEDSLLMHFHGAMCGVPLITRIIIQVIEVINDNVDFLFRMTNDNTSVFVTDDSMILEDKNYCCILCIRTSLRLYCL